MIFKKMRDLWNLSILMVIISASACVQGFGTDYAWESPFSHLHETACQGYPIHLQCPGTDVVEVISAEYGRTNRDTCASDEARDVDCRLPGAKGITSARCNNRTSCRLAVSSDNFPDPCPGTSKYLQVRYRCVKYMFGCPGTLLGIGSNSTVEISLSPEAGSWTRDPINHPEHVYYARESGQVIEEYANMENFKNGDDSLHIYDLPSFIEGTSYVVFDRNVFYIERRTRDLIKYSLKIRLRLKAGSLPGSYFSQLSSDYNKVHLAIDEQGLWAVYMGNPETGLIEVSLINKDTLAIETTWKTAFLQSSSLHSFMICGVLYVVGKSRGEIEYMYNTNLPSRSGLVSVGFDQSRSVGSSRQKISNNMFLHSSRGRSPPSRSFLTYNFTSLVYNPRDRLLYAWDSARSRTVSYNLHFSSENPTRVDESSTSLLTTSAATPVTTPRKQSGSAPHSSTEISMQDQFCSQEIEFGLEWPRTEWGNFASVQCPNHREGSAVRLCLKDSDASKAKWDPKGPNLTGCGTLFEVIESKLTQAVPDVIPAADLLSQHLTSQNSLDSQTVAETARLMGEIARVAPRARLTPQQTRRLVENLVGCESRMTRVLSSWRDLDRSQKHLAVDSILTSVETVGALLAASVANASYLPREKEEMVASDGVSVCAVAHDGTQPLTPHLGSASALIPVEEVQRVDGLSFAAFITHNALAEVVGATPDVGGEWELDSTIFSVALRPSARHGQLTPPVKVVFRTWKDSNSPRKCVYWEFSHSSSAASWRSDGCRVTSSNSSFVECSCDHVTSFAVLVNNSGEFPVSGATSLGPVLIVSICLSLVCLLISFLTFTCFRNLRDDMSCVHKNLYLALFVAEGVFMVGIKQTGSSTACAIVAGLLHFFFLSAFLWMAVEAFQLYTQLMEVLLGRSRWLFYYLIGYGVPGVIVGVSFGVNSEGYGSGEVCWLKVDSGFIWSFVGPVCAVVLSNLILLAITIAKLYRRNRQHSDVGKVNELKTSVRGASILLCLLGITWAFGILWVWGETPIMAYLFCVFNAFQGLFIFIFHCLFSSKVRMEYKKLFARCLCCHSKAPGAYVTDSMSFSKQYPHQQNARLLSEHHVPPHEVTLVSNRTSRGGRGSRKLPSSPDTEVPLDSGVRIISKADCGLHHPPQKSDKPHEEAAYDHLEHHRHMNNCDHTHHAGGWPNAQVACVGRRSQGCSQTIGQLHSTRAATLQEKTAIQRTPLHKACTLSNSQGQDQNSQSELLVPRSDSGDSCTHHPSGHTDERYLVPTSHVLLYQENEARRALVTQAFGRLGGRPPSTSSGSDDPVVNDLSASSSAGSKPSSITGTIDVNPLVVTSGPPFPPPRFRYKAEDSERDENDLEVQRLTAPERCVEEDAENRDSAFCQSIMELESPYNRNSSTSSRYSGGAPDPRIGRHHMQWPEHNLTTPKPDLSEPRSFGHPTDTRQYVSQARHLHGEGRPPSFSHRAFPPSHEPTNQYRFSSSVDHKTSCL